MDVRAVLLAVEEVVRGPAFERWRARFVSKHVHAFSYADEDRLEYTAIHGEYEQGVEKMIADGLPDSVDMAEFMEALPAFLEGPGGKDEAIGKAVTTLLEVGDYRQFREMMLYTKKELDDGEEKHSEARLRGVSTKGTDVSGVATLDVEGMMDMCAALASAADEEGWESCLVLDWMKIDKKPVPEGARKQAGEIYLRGVWTMDLSFDECTDMMFTMGPRRKNWDSNFSSVSFPLGGDDSSDDVVTSVDLNFGYLINLVMFGSGSTYKLVTRNIRRWDYPATGCVTYAMVPWDLKTGKLDAKHKLLSLKTGTISPHPSLAGKVVMTSLETNTMGSMPTWALHWMMRATAPSMMKGLESRYIASSRRKVDVRVIRPSSTTGARVRK